MTVLLQTLNLILHWGEELLPSLILSSYNFGTIKAIVANLTYLLDFMFIAKFVDWDIFCYHGNGFADGSVFNFTNGFADGSIF